MSSKAKVTTTQQQQARTATSMLTALAFGIDDTNVMVQPNDDESENDSAWLDLPKQQQKPRSIISDDDVNSNILTVPVAGSNDNCDHHPHLKNPSTSGNNDSQTTSNYQKQQQQEQEPEQQPSRPPMHPTILPRLSSSLDDKKKIKMQKKQEQARQQLYSSGRHERSQSFTGGGSSNNSVNNNNIVLKSVQKVGRHAARTTKQVVWDTNELSITAALSAVDVWERLYHSLRRMVLLVVHNSARLYDATVQNLHHAANRNEFIQFVRDWIALPTISGMERLVAGTITFLQSNQAKSTVNGSVDLVRHVPLIGNTVLAPCLVTSGSVLNTICNIIRYPIPSKTQVRNTVDHAMTLTKWLLAATYNEIALYVQRADANITRTLSHTQWKVLGSGPYATLPPDSKRTVIDHLCDRYYMLESMTSRYELAAHVKKHNFTLYIDLVWTGIWKHRGGRLTANDEWLDLFPNYRRRNNAFLLTEKSKNKEATPNLQYINGLSSHVSTLWFRLPYINGERPSSSDAPWMCFPRQDQRSLEERYLELVQDYESKDDKNGKKMSVNDKEHMVPSNKVKMPENYTSASSSDLNETDETKSTASYKYNFSMNKPLHPTIAQWYDTPSTSDVLVDQKRHSVSFQLCCIKCRKVFSSSINKYGDFCDTCKGFIEEFNDKCEASTPLSGGNIINNYSNEKDADEAEYDDDSNNNQLRSNKSVIDGYLRFALPPLSMVYRPNFWRFYGPGDEVRRALWFLDIPGRGLQPFDEEAHSVLEDAFLFLQWMKHRHDTLSEKNVNRSSENGSDDNMNYEGDDDKSASNFDGDLLTVEVMCPDGTERLVQFGSLNRATAIQKGLQSAMALFKLRVYRGAWLDYLPASPAVHRKHMAEEVEEKIAHAVNEYGCLGDTVVPNASLRSLVIDPELVVEENLLADVDNSDHSLAAPPDRMRHDDMARYVQDDPKKNDDVSHLVLVVHGIGEMLRSADVFGIAMPSLSSIVDCCGYLRKNNEEITKDCSITNLVTRTSLSLSEMVMDETSEGQCFTASSTGRLEYLPVEWHEAFTILSKRRYPPPPTLNRPNFMIQDISLRTIPNMRNFANDTLMDVLYFMSPVHHDMMIEVVINEMNFLVNKFRKMTDFKGSVSVIGHSLGSIITWDILDHLSKNVSCVDPTTDESLPGLSFNSSSPNEINNFQVTSTKSSNVVRDPDQQSPNEINNCHVASTKSSSVVRDPDQRCLPLPHLDFEVDNFFMLGSPVAVFLMIRNQRVPLSDDFYLRGCRRVFNIFHPYDPVAYRIEPCIDPRNANVEPCIIMHWNGGYRMQYQTRLMWRKLVETTMKTQQDFVGAFEERMARIGLLGMSSTPGDDETASDISCSSERSEGPRTGQLNRGVRIDYMLQESEIENANEYVAALAAHSSYWAEKDLSLFIASRIIS